MNNNEVCGVCQGTGHDHEVNGSCFECGGTGRVSDDGNLDGGAGECVACDGTGAVDPVLAALIAPKFDASEACDVCGCAWTFHEAHGACPNGSYRE